MSRRQRVAVQFHGRGAIASGTEDLKAMAAAGCSTVELLAAAVRWADKFAAELSSITERTAISRVLNMLEAAAVAVLDAKPPVEVDELLTTVEVADWLKVSVSRVRGWRKSGALQGFGFRPGRGKLFFRRSAVEGFITSAERRFADV